MRSFIFLVLFFFFSAVPVITRAQSQQEIQKEMARMVDDLKNQITDLEKQIVAAKKSDPDSVADLENELSQLKQQLNMIEGVNKSMSRIKITDAQLNADNYSVRGEIPMRDTVRINSLPKKVLSDDELVLFVKKVHTEVEKTISAAEKTKAQQLLNELKTKDKSPYVSANLAAECWLAGAGSMGLYLMGKACIEDISNTDNLNNYAAFLTMKGGEHAAIPILENLHKKFPSNSTILNNLGQAWYGLGEMNYANQYLDSTIHIYNMHAEANETKSEIENSEGKTQESIKSLKRSIKENYTPEKEARLTELGGKLEYEDITFKYPPGKADVLGIEKFMFIIPGYPFEGGVSAEISRMEWQGFRENVFAAQEKIKEEKKQIKARVDAYNQRLIANPLLLKPYNNPIYITASRKRTLLIEWATYKALEIDTKIMEAGDSVSKWKEEYNKSIQNISDCGARKGLATSFLTKANTLWQQRNSELMTFQKEMLNAEAKLSLYANTDRSLYELEMANIKENFLGYLGNLGCEFEVGCLPTPTQNQHSGKLLPDFDETNCQYKTDLNMYFTKINVECNKMTTDIEVGPFKGSLEENLATGKYKGKAELEQSFGKDEIKLGPLEAGAELAGKVGVEFTEQGIQDVYVEGTAEIEAGPVEVSGATGRYGFIAGKGSITGSGALEGISIK